MKRSEIINLFEYYLSRPPCKSGIRLRSEPDLGRLFNESRQKIRRALDVLVERGFLTRRHGSGTFVRKVVPEAEAPSPEFVRKHTILLPEQLFIESKQGTRLKPVRKKQQLHIGLSGDPALLTSTNRSIFQAAKKRVEELGHKAVVYSQLTYDTLNLKGTKELAEELRKTKCDGYLIESWWGDSIKSAFKVVFEQENIPLITYFWPGSIRIKHEPLVKLDTDEALARGIRILAENGYKKITAIIQNYTRHPADSELLVYLNTLQEYALDYQNAVLVKGLQGTDVVDALDKAFANNLPEAIYIANDHYITAVCKWLENRGIRPKHDIGIITNSNKGCKLPNTHNWSRLEFDPRQVGYLAVDNIVKAIESPDERMCSFSLQAAWIPGDTH
jgi:DNA-binding LacI/PurR family transcriptional regulator/DNA-binding transcriptional regulator YhcF (GntR family)